MSQLALDILHKMDLPQGGFAGLTERRLVMAKHLWGDNADPGTWDGIGNFVYLADAQFQPKGETTMHSHKEIDVISVMVEGRIAHQGSLENGGSLDIHEAQVQRAGGEGFSHNEVNPDDSTNQMLQLWVSPEREGQPAGYMKFSPQWGETTRIYGGENTGDGQPYAAATTVDIAMLLTGEHIVLDGNYLAYVAKGRGLGGDQCLNDGDLIRGGDTVFNAETDTQLLIIRSLQ